MTESPIFLKAQQQDRERRIHRLAIADVLRRYPRELALASTATIAALSLQTFMATFAISMARESGPVSPVFADEPTPGTARSFELLMRAHATDINDRVLDSLRRPPGELFVAEDVRLPEGLEVVRVEATLVRHPPVAPAFRLPFHERRGQHHRLR